jgi:hemerythrin
MPLIDPEHLPQLPVAFMNADHAEEARRVNAVAERLDALEAGQAERAQVVAALDELYTATRGHFSREERAMVDASFPAYAFHQAEHVRVLSELGEAQRRFREGGSAAELRTFVQSLPNWLARHIETMDTVTARYVAEWGLT